MDLSVTFCGIKLDSPFVLGSGPLGNGARGLAACSAHGAGAVTTKTIYRRAGQTVSPCMSAQGPRTMLNNEGGSDIPAELWIARELPAAKQLGVKTLIANIGELYDEDARLAQECVQAGADVIEVGGYLTADELVETAAIVKQAVQVPVIAKVTQNWDGVSAEKVAERLLNVGLDGITAMDSIGTGLRLDLSTGRSLLGGSGFGYISGDGILPLSLKTVYEIGKHSDKDIIGMGGIVTGSNALEMLMAGARCCGVCTLPIMYGPQAFERLNTELSAALALYGYRSAAEATGKALQWTPHAEIRFEQFRYDAQACTHCGRCIHACAFGARSDQDGIITVDEGECRRCGLCFTMCKTGGIGLED